MSQTGTKDSRTDVPLTHLGKRHYLTLVLCQVPEALGKGKIALGKAFVECGTR